MVRKAHTLVSNGGPSRKGEKRKKPKIRTKESRAIEQRRRSTKRIDDNVELEKEGLYICNQCGKVKSNEDFPQHVPTSGKFTRYDSCKQCLDAIKSTRVLTGVTQKNRDRNATRSLDWQRVIKVSLQGKHGYDEYEAECDAANPPKTAQIFKIRCTKEEMVEKLPLVEHGLVECILSHCSSNMHCCCRREQRGADEVRRSLNTDATASPRDGWYRTVFTICCRC